MAEHNSLSDLEELIRLISGAPDVQTLRATYSMHRDNSDPVDIGKLLSTAPPVHVEEFFGAVLRCLPEISAFGGASTLTTVEWDALRVAAEFTVLAHRSRDAFPSSNLQAIAARLHDALPSAKPPLDAVLLRALTPLLAAGVDVAEHALPALLARSFGDGGPENDGRPPAIVDVKRVYAAHEKLNGLDLRSGGPNDALRNQLLRCPSALLYLRVAEGKKFLAFLLTLRQISQGIFDAILLLLTTARKSQAKSIGDVFLFAWRTKGVDRFRATLINVVEKAIVASSEPLATNLRTVLSVFHVNRRLPGMDSMLHRVYGPTLMPNLMVANPLVRRNSVMILCDAYPVHDPESSHAEIETILNTQTDKIIALLRDPVPIVRTVVVQGVCRILAFYFEVVPAAKSKRMIDIMTTKLAFDSTSIAVRMAVFEGLKALLGNHSTHELLKAMLPRLRPLIHDTAERVRVAFLDLLVQLKAKRIVGLPYFAVVPVHEILTRLPDDSPGVAASIMKLIVTLYFPLEKSGKTQKEIRQSQVRACHNMLTNSPRAASCFYKRLHVYIPPGPLLTFSMSISSEGINAADRARNLKKSSPDPAVEEAPTRKLRTAKRKESQKKRARRLKAETEASEDKENKENQEENDNSQSAEPSAEQLLALSADVLQSLRPALRKESNRALQDSVDAVYKPSDMKSYLLQRRYSSQARAALWRIASCVSAKTAKSVIGLWRQEFRRVGDSLYDCRTQEDKSDSKHLLAALISCGIAWEEFDALGAVLSDWANQIQDKTFATQAAELKNEKKKQRKKGLKAKQSIAQPQFAESKASSSKNKAVYALVEVVNALTADSELREHFLCALDSQVQECKEEKEGDCESMHAMSLVSIIRQGCVGAVDNVIADQDEGVAEGASSYPDDQMLALMALSSAWKMISLVVGTCPRVHPDIDSSSPVISRVASDFDDLLDWSTKPGLLSAFSPENEFCAAFFAVWLAHCADVVCLGQLPDNGLLALDKFVQGVSFTLRGHKGSSIVRALAELLRVSYQLGEHAMYVSAPDTSLLVRVRNSVTKSVIDLIASIPTDDDVYTSSDRSVLVQALGELLNGLGSAFNEIVTDALKVAFDHHDDAHQSLLAALLAAVLQRHSIRSDRCWGLEQGDALLLSCFGALAESEAAVHAARLIKFAAKNVFEEDVPIEGIRAADGFSALTKTLRVLLNYAPDLCGASEKATANEIAAARESLELMETRGQQLRSMQEVTADKTRADKDNVEPNIASAVD